MAPRVVALGGGHGLAATLRALQPLTERLTAIVTVADDGGSSGRLRAGYRLLPPGDLRMALAALAAADHHNAVLGEVMQHRFPDGVGGPDDPAVAGLVGHPVGNLLLTALLQQLGDPVAALATMGRMLGLPDETRVLPMSCSPLDIVAEVAGLSADGELTRVTGQVAVATTAGRVLALQLLPPDARACPEALAAVAAADMVVLGPGSLFTSVLPHLLLPDLRAELVATPAPRVLVLNLAQQQGETDGFPPEAHLEVLAAYAPELSLDVVVADRTAVLDRHGLMRGLVNAVEDCGARLHLATLARPASPAEHDPDALAAALAAVLRDGLTGTTSVSPRSASRPDRPPRPSRAHATRTPTAPPDQNQ